MNEPTRLPRHDRQRATLTIVPSTVAAITAHEIDRWSCHCGNAPHCSGFEPIDRRGNAVEPTPEHWPEALYMCNVCGLVMDADTFDATARTVAVIGRITKNANQFKKGSDLAKFRVVRAAGENGWPYQLMNRARMSELVAVNAAKRMGTPNVDFLTESSSIRLRAWNETAADHGAAIRATDALLHVLRQLTDARDDGMSATCERSSASTTLTDWTNMGWRNRPGT